MEAPPMRLIPRSHPVPAGIEHERFRMPENGRRR